MARTTHPIRFPLLAISLFLLLLALWAGLTRLGWNAAWLQSRLVLGHGPFMVCGFLGTLISLERSVALGRWWAYLPPLFSAAGSLWLAARLTGTAPVVLIVLGSAGLVVLFAYIIVRQPALFTLTMGLGSAAWLTGNLFWLGGVAIPRMVHWWIGFLVLTIVGERLELNRFLSPSRYARGLFEAALALFLTGLIGSSAVPLEGNRVTGLGMLGFALWLARYDVARSTIRRKGLPRFIAVSLIAGYAWLGIGGLIWLLATRLEAAGSPVYLVYDASLHGIFLGFVFSMIFAHAPIVFPAVTGRPLAFRGAFYAHVLLLQLSLAARVAGDLAGSLAVYRWAGAANVAAVLLFFCNTLHGVLAGRRGERTLLADQARSPR